MEWSRFATSLRCQWCTLKLRWLQVFCPSNPSDLKCCLVLQMWVDVLHLLQTLQTLYLILWAKLHSAANNWPRRAPGHPDVGRVYIMKAERKNNETVTEVPIVFNAWPSARVITFVKQLWSVIFKPEVAYCVSNIHYNIQLVYRRFLNEISLRSIVYFMIHWCELH
jgi:hypothetical protein